MISLVILIYLCIAATFTLTKMATAYGSIFLAIAVRMIPAGLISLGYLFFFDRENLKFASRDLLNFLLIAFSQIYISSILIFWAMFSVSSVKTVVLQSTIPFFMAAIGYFLFKERISRYKALGLIIGFIGLIPIFMASDKGGPLGSAAFNISGYDIAVIASGLACNIPWFIIKRLTNRKYSLVCINGFVMLLGGIMSLITSFFVEPWHPFPVEQVKPFFTLALLLSFLMVIIQNLYAWLLQHYSVTFMSCAGFLTPIFGSFLGWFFLKETISWHYIIALAIVSVGVFLFYKGEVSDSTTCS